MSALGIEHARPLAPLTTLRLGGSAAHFLEARERSLVSEALAWAEQRQLAVGILAGGSNLVIGDAGFPGLVLRVATRGVELARAGELALLTVQAGEPWDEVVTLAVEEGLAGLECLTGIPGSAGATPIQNVGAYGQEVSEVIDAVEVFARRRRELVWLSPAACGFGYRNSRFKRQPDRYVVLSVRFRLRVNGAPSLRYPELSRALSGRGAPSLCEVQAAVRALRAAKGMLMDASFEPSAGSFFMNPIVARAEAERVVERALAGKLVERREDVPRFAAGEGRVKLAAAWLVERSGIARGTRLGQVGVSARHALALVHHGGGSTRELLALASSIQKQVEATFGVALQIEPVCW